MKKFTIALVAVLVMAASVVIAPAKDANAASCVYSTFRRGVSGSDCVRYIQRMLNGVSSS